jgi:hypothetical protein
VHQDLGLNFVGNKLAVRIVSVSSELGVEKFCFVSLSVRFQFVSLQEFGLGDDAVYVFTYGIVGSTWARPESWDGTIQ